MRTRNSATLLLVLSLVFVLTLCLSALACAIAGSIQISSTGSRDGPTSIFLFVLGTIWSGFLLVPTIWYAARHLRDRSAMAGQERAGLEDPELGEHELGEHGPFSVGWTTWLPFLLMLLLYPLVLFAGSLAARSDQLAWWALPLLQIPAATLPVFWLSGLALRKLSPDSKLHRWGAFGMGLTLGPSLIMLVELGVVFILVLAFAIRLSSDSNQAFELMMLAQRLQYARPDPAVIVDILEPYLTQPVFLLFLFGFVAILVPVVEEALKPIGVWLLAGRRLNPVQGFAAGALSGAGYALFENLFITAPFEGWALISIGRIGTTTMHILTAGLTGYALAEAWGKGRYLRLTACFTVAVLIHALWNGLIVFSVISAFPALLGRSSQLAPLGQVASGILIGLFIVLLLGLIFFNRRLRRYAIIPPHESDVQVSTSEELHAPEVETGPDSSKI